MASLGANVSLVQLGIAAITLALAVACVRCHIDYLGRGFQHARQLGGGGRPAWKPNGGQDPALG